MAEVVYEIGRAGQWVRVGSRGENEPPGSFSSAEPAGRQVYLFGFLDDAPGVWRSIEGLDSASPTVRVIHTAGLALLADLRLGPHEMDIVMPYGRPHARFRLEP